MPGSVVTITYAPRFGSFKEGEDLLFLGGVNGEAPSFAALVQRIKRGDADRQIFEFEINVPVGTTLMSFYFTDGKDKDDNDGQFYHLTTTLSKASALDRVDLR